MVSEDSGISNASKRQSIPWEVPMGDRTARRGGIRGRISKALASRRVRVLAAAAVLGILILCVALGVTLSRRKGAIPEDESPGGDPADPSDPSVARANLGYATYKGTVLENGVAQYAGLRYAAPPTGNLRFRPPQDPLQETEVKAAFKFRSKCLGMSSGYPAEAQDEDCLFANVWAPANATVDSKLPVWLYIQGGGYTANANANYDGSLVVEKSNNNVIYVNCNYRVGIYGFLASKRMSDGNSTNLNNGLLDQRMVMQWIQKHITQFGGDPDHVVINGGSAGAGSVALHLVAHGGRDDGLFVGAIGESVFFPAQPPVADLEWQFDHVLEQTGCGSGVADAMSCLRGLDPAALQAANEPSPFPGRPDSPDPLFYFTPCIDGDFLQDLPYRLYERGQIVDVPILFGTTSNEGRSFAADAATADDMSRFLRNNYPRLTDTDMNAISGHYPLQRPALPEHKAWFASAASAYGEATFICPGVHILDAATGSGHATSPATAGVGSYGGNSTRRRTAPAWGYRYDVHDDANTATGLGVPHMFQTAAVLGPESLPDGVASPSYYTYNAAMVPLVMGYWTSFVRTLDPNPLRAAGAPAWEAWDSVDAGEEQPPTATTVTGSNDSNGGGKRMRFTSAQDVALEMVTADLRERCNMWRVLAPSTMQKRRARRARV